MAGLLDCDSVVVVVVVVVVVAARCQHSLQLHRTTVREGKKDDAQCFNALMAITSMMTVIVILHV